MQFSNQNKKSEIITPFINLDNCVANDSGLIIPGIIKINYENKGIDCYCLGLDVAEQILSNICNIEVSSDANNGLITFPKCLSNILIKTNVVDFKGILDLASRGNVKYINTEDRKLKAVIPLSHWLSADISIDRNKAFVNFKFNDYEISVLDGSAANFCNRVKTHPLISASSLSNYFDFGNETKIKPSIEYICFWKVLKSPNGYKRYSNFINSINDKAKIAYDEGKKYSCKFNGGKIDFQLLNIGDQYPKKVIAQVEDINNESFDILKKLQKHLGFKTIDLVSKVINLNLNVVDLLEELKFYKANNFFIFTNKLENFESTYDIGSCILSVKKTFSLDDNIDENDLNEYMVELKKWITSVIEYDQ